MEETEDLKRSVQTCVDCNAQSPQTETNFTLISARYGWRLSLETPIRTRVRPSTAAATTMAITPKRKVRTRSSR